MSNFVKQLKNKFSKTEVPLRDEFRHQIYNKIKSATEEESGVNVNPINIYIKLFAGAAVACAIILAIFSTLKLWPNSIQNNQIANNINIKEVLAASIKNTYLLASQDELRYIKINRSSHRLQETPSLSDLLKEKPINISKMYFIDEQTAEEIWGYKDNNVRIDSLSSYQNQDNSKRSEMSFNSKNNNYCLYIEGYFNNIENKYTDDYIECRNDQENYNNTFDSNKRYAFYDTNNNDFNPKIVEDEGKAYIEFTTKEDYETIFFEIGINGAIEGSFDNANTLDTSKYSQYNKRKEDELYYHRFLIDKKNIISILLENQNSFQFQVVALPYNQDESIFSQVFQYNFETKNITPLSPEGISKYQEEINSETYIDMAFKGASKIAIEMLNKEEFWGEPILKEKLEINNIQYYKLQYKLPDYILNEYYNPEKELANKIKQEIYIELLLNIDENTVPEYTIKMGNIIFDKNIIEETKIINNINPEEFFTEKYWRKSLKE